MTPEKKKFTNLLNLVADLKLEINQAIIHNLADKESLSSAWMHIDQAEINITQSFINKTT